MTWFWTLSWNERNGDLSCGVAPYNVVEIFDVSVEASFFIERFFCLKAVGSGFLHIVIKYLSVYTASRPVGQQYVYCLIRGTNKLTRQSKSDIVAMLLTLILLLCSSRLRSTFLTTTKTVQFRRPVAGLSPGRATGRFVWDLWWINWHWNVPFTSGQTLFISGRNYEKFHSF